ncbi:MULTISPECIES: cation:dicarboxylate symporter family transporter [unclassified Arcicella]|uniref:cation:dicarboxylate symporter family transporter n=1 Tax=unclassified Arcicella TaxID=2644986 RepID=UPI002855861C|nr:MULTISPECIES: cation:dicarboxylase symporter family transporter [unclassified Arcicella]MDR6560092.1 aerobic C4-dicarboxylate transport protein [Arcicella sp. BE51]MDR6810301.1 aerobic C4-dicarboxylate transport protein [Arcicella sp. BE140]MDR6821651.1 aerobic C4-dicarboxylate transport protein [Arcicella sp. BE139]
MKKLFKNLTFWVLTAITAGVLLGHFAPEIALQPILEKPIKFSLYLSEFEIKTSFSELLSSIFISIVKIFICPIIFITIMLGIISMGDLKKVGKVGAKSLLYFEVVTTLALFIGIIMANIIRPGDGVVTSEIKGGDISKYTKSAESFSWLKFLMDNATLQILILAIILGVILSNYSKRNEIVQFLQPVSKKIFWALHKVMLFAPVGAFGGMAFTIAKYGVHTLLPLGKLMVTVYCTMAIFIFVVLYFILRMYKVNLWKFLKYIREELLIVLGTSSSEAALPSLMEKLEKMGCSKSVVGLVVPAGYSFNLDGTTIYLSMAVLFLAQVFNVHLDLQQILTVIGILMVTSKGAAGVTGSGFIVLASTLTAIKVIPVEGLALLLGVDRFMSEARAITNFIGNGVATIWLANNEKEFDREQMERVFE